MKKQNRLVSPFGGKLNLSKRTISNLDSNQLNSKVGGAPTNRRTCTGPYTCAYDWTQRGYTCINCGSF